MNGHRESSARFSKRIQYRYACFWNPSPLSKERGMESKGGFVTARVDFPKVWPTGAQTKLTFKCNFYFALLFKRKKRDRKPLFPTYKLFKKPSPKWSPRAVTVAESEAPDQWGSGRQGRSSGTATSESPTSSHAAFTSSDQQERLLAMQSANK